MRITEKVTGEVTEAVMALVVVKSDTDDNVRSNGKNNYIGILNVIVLVMIEVVVAVKMEMLEGILAMIAEAIWW